MPAISVIVPVYNVELYLHKCVESILTQTFTDFELILVDDGSPDNCGIICDEYARKDNRVHVIHQKNGGLSAARNAGVDWAFENSDSEWLSFVDSDDWIAEKYLECLYKGAQDNNLAISSCGFIRTECEIDAVDTEIHFQVMTPEDYYVNNRTNSVIACGKLYNKACFGEFRYPDGKVHEDEFITYQILFQSKKIAVTESVLYYYFQNPESIIHRKWSLQDRMYGIAAMEEQLVFFNSKGFDKAFERCFQEVTNNISKYTNECNSNEKRMLVRELRRILKLYIQYAKTKIGELPWVWETAYPKRMKAYWLITAQLRKVRNGKD